MCFVFSHYSRESKCCPLCGKTELLNLRRHLKGNKNLVGHGLTGDQCDELMNKYTVRKKYTYKSKRPANKTKNYHKTKICPFPGCKKAAQENIYEHLMGYHRLERNDPIYKKYCKIAEIARMYCFINYCTDFVLHLFGKDING